MNNQTKSDYLSIEIPEDMKDTITSLKIHDDLNIITTITRNDAPVFKSIMFKNINKRTILDWEKTMTALSSQLLIRL